MLVKSFRPLQIFIVKYISFIYKHNFVSILMQISVLTSKSMEYFLLQKYQQRKEWKHILI